jgi:hypothetical protein
MEQAYATFRSSLGESRAPSGRGAYDQSREVLFAACRSREVVLERDGHGHFTMRATGLLASGIQGITNAEFQERVVQVFGENSGQNPELHCANASRVLPPINRVRRTHRVYDLEFRERWTVRLAERRRAHPRICSSSHSRLRHG